MDSGWESLVREARQYAFRKDYGVRAAELGEITQHPQRYYFEHSEGNVPEFLTHSITEMARESRLAPTA